MSDVAKTANPCTEARARLNQVTKAVKFAKGLRNCDVKGQTATEKNACSALDAIEVEAYYNYFNACYVK